MNGQMFQIASIVATSKKALQLSEILERIVTIFQCITEIFRAARCQQFCRPLDIHFHNLSFFELSAFHQLRQSFSRRFCISYHTTGGGMNERASQASRGTAS